MSYCNIKIYICIFTLFLHIYSTTCTKNSTEIRDLPIPILPTKFNLTGIIGQIINSTSALFNFTGSGGATGGTTAAPILPTTAPPNTTCTCGTGAKPKITFPTRSNINSDTKFRQFDDEYYYDRDDDDYKFDIGDGRSDIEIETEESSSSGPSARIPEDEERIVHGVAANPNGWPWMAGLINGYSLSNASNAPPLNLFCGGTLINSWYVVTAAHCFGRFKDTNEIIKNVSIILGSNSISSKINSRTVVKLSAVNIHPKFNTSSQDNDITLLRLAVPVKASSSIGPICLSQTGTPFPNRKVSAIGWGTTNVSGSTAQPWLREAGLKTVTNAKCSQSYASDGGSGITKNMICATGLLPLANTDTCRGDSGGPLMLWRNKTMTYTLIGITSFGPTICGQKGIPGVYTRVNNYINFIKSVTNGTTFCSNSF